MTSSILDLETSREEIIEFALNGQTEEEYARKLADMYKERHGDRLTYENAYKAVSGYASANIVELEKLNHYFCAQIFIDAVINSPYPNDENLQKYYRRYRD